MPPSDGVLTIGGAGSPKKIFAQAGHIAGSRRNRQSAWCSWEQPRRSTSPDTGRMFRVLASAMPARNDMGRATLPTSGH
ncbi:MAG: hypothetical protein AAGH72_00015 [Verrucomicrobiota bacterium]